MADHTPRYVASNEQHKYLGDAGGDFPDYYKSEWAVRLYLRGKKHSGWWDELPEGVDWSEGDRGNHWVLILHGSENAVRDALGVMVDMYGGEIIKAKPVRKNHNFGDGGEDKNAPKMRRPDVIEPSGDVKQDHTFSDDVFKEGDVTGSKNDLL